MINLMKGGYKIKLKPEDSRNVQGLLFNAGCMWWSGNSNYTESADAIYIRQDGLMTYTCDDMEYFDKHHFVEIGMGDLV